MTRRVPERYVGLAVAVGARLPARRARTLVGTPPTNGFVAPTPGLFAVAVMEYPPAGRFPAVCIGTVSGMVTAPPWFDLPPPSGASNKTECTSSAVAIVHYTTPDAEENKALNWEPFVNRLVTEALNLDNLPSNEEDRDAEPDPEV